MSEFDEIDIRAISLGSPWRNAPDLVRMEHESFRLWRDYNNHDQAVILALIRDKLIRLLSNPGWVPGALKASESQRLEVTFVIDTGNAEHTLLRMGYRQDDELREGLLRLAKENGST